MNSIKSVFFVHPLRKVNYIFSIKITEERALYKVDGYEKIFTEKGMSVKTFQEHGFKSAR